MVRVIAGRMQDRDADQPTRIYCAARKSATCPAVHISVPGERGQEGCGTRGERTIGMPDLPQELHGGRRERVVLGELELGREDAAFERRALRSLDQGLPVQQVVLADGAGGDAVGRVVGEGAVLLQKPSVCG